MYIFGAGNFGRETRDAIIESGATVSSFLADTHPKRDLLSPVELFDASPAPSNSLIVVAVADPNGRTGIVVRLDSCGWKYGTVVHPRAALGSGVSVGEGSIVLALSYISTDAELGRHVHVNYGVTFGHDSVAEDFVTILPNSTIGGGVRLGRGSMVGSGSVILPGLRIGERSVVGAGAVVTKDVPADTVVVGVPARAIRQSH